jgi:hypothetical protein
MVLVVGFWRGEGGEGREGGREERILQVSILKWEQ